MNIKRITPILLAPLVFLGVSASANAAPTIPPSEECLQLTNTMVDEWKILQKENTYVNDDQERELWKPIVEAGCLERNPIADIKATQQCPADLGQATSYLGPANAAMRPFHKRYRKRESNRLKSANRVYRKLTKAQSRGQKKAVRVLRAKLRKIDKSYNRDFRKIKRDARPTVNEYIAPIILVYADLYTRGCKLPDSWFKKNAPAFTALYLW